MTKSEFSTEFHKYLLSRGFPKESIIAELSIGQGERTDFAVIERNTRELVCIFEYFGRMHGEPLDEGRRKLEGRVAFVSDSGVSAFLVVPADNPTFDEPFQFYRLRSSGLEQVPAVLLPTYDELLARKFTGAKSELTDKQSEVDRHCILIAAFCIVAVLADVYVAQSGCAHEILTTNRCLVLGVAAALLVAPGFQRIRFLGVELERWVRQKDEKGK